jgi:hypothetical protein
MFDLIIFIIGFVFIIFFCIFLYNGGTIFDLITFSNFNYIYTKIENDIDKSLKTSNKEIEYNIAPTEIYIYRIGEEAIAFNALLNQITITQQDKTKISLDVYKDLPRLVPIFALLKREFNYESFNIS